MEEAGEGGGQQSGRPRYLVKGLRETPEKALDPADLNVPARPKSKLKEKVRLATSDSLFPVIETKALSRWKSRGRHIGKKPLGLLQISEPKKKGENAEKDSKPQEGLKENRAKEITKA